MSIDRTARFLALSCVGAFATAAGAQTAATTGAPPAGTELQGGTTYGDAIEEVKVDRVESPKATAPILDTPQTITVISNQTLQKQNLLTLRDALSTIPGITFGAGEGGGGYGDSINLRGYSANNDITYDGVRDSAQYSRTETFNLQQIEVYNGANTVFNGSGSVGGTINLVTKVPMADSLTVAQAGIGTDDYYRATVDSNVRVNDLVAVRLNGVFHRNDYPGRDVEKYKRWGIAPSATIGIDGPTSLTVQYLHQEDDNIPLFGIPYFRASNSNPNGVPTGVDRDDYFGIENLDDQSITVDQATLRFAHAFSDAISLRNLTRYQRVKQDSVTSAPQGTYCLANNLTPTGGRCTVNLTAPFLQNGVLRQASTASPVTLTVPAGSYYPSGPRGLVRDQDNQLFYTQTDLKAELGTGRVQHTVVLGGALTKEDYTLVQGNLLRSPTGVTAIENFISIADPVTTYTGPVNFIRSARSTGTTENAAIYLFDTTKLGEQFEVNVGVRYEHNLAVFRPDTIATSGAALGTYTRGRSQRSSDNFLSYRGGLVFKPAPAYSLYASYGFSQVPTSATVRLGCGALVTGTGLGAQTNDPCDVAAEKARTYEIGGKAELFDRKLLVTAAVFRNDRYNFRIATNDPIVGSLPVADGRSRADGIALGVSGNITPAWSWFGNYTYLKTKILQSVSDFCLANPGRLTSTTTGGTTTISNACGNSTAVIDPAAGDQLIQTPRHAGSLFTTYTLPFGLQLGYGATYQGNFYINNGALVSPTAAGANGLANGAAVTTRFRARDYLTHRLFASYEVTPGLTAQINVQNVTDEKYLTNVRNNGWAMPGEGRQAIFSLVYSM